MGICFDWWNGGMVEWGDWGDWGGVLIETGLGYVRDGGLMGIER